MATQRPQQGSDLLPTATSDCSPDAPSSTQLLKRHLLRGIPREEACQFESDPWVGKIPWRRAWQPTPVFWPGKSHGQRSLADCSPRGHTEQDKTSDLDFQMFNVRCWCICFRSRVGTGRDTRASTLGNHRLNQLNKSTPQECKRHAGSGHRRRAGPEQGGRPAARTGPQGETRLERTRTHTARQPDRLAKRGCVASVS